MKIIDELRSRRLPKDRVLTRFEQREAVFFAARIIYDNIQCDATKDAWETLIWAKKERPKLYNRAIEEVSK